MHMKECRNFSQVRTWMRARWGWGAINEAVVGCGLFLLFLFCGPVSGGGDAHALPFVVGQTLAKADTVCAT
jgi:hypothetical protein